LMEHGATAEEGTVGTPDYIAPEIFLRTGHGPAVDIWALGCIMYEFLVGITPYYGESCEEIFENIINNSIVWPESPDEVSAEARDLITKLLTMDPKERLNVEGCKAHPFFKEIDWGTLLNQKGLFVPKIKNIEDMTYFEPRNVVYEFTDNELLTDEECRRASLSYGNPQTSLRYRNFSFMHVQHLEDLTKKAAQEQQNKTGNGNAPHSTGNGPAAPSNGQ